MEICVDDPDEQIMIAKLPDYPDIGGDIPGVGYVFVMDEEEPKIEISQETKVMKVRPYHCDRCDYKAGRRDTLNNHIASVHEKALNFVCDFCDFKTSRKGTLTRHIKVCHEPNNPFICPICGFRTVRAKTLNNHVKNEHKEGFGYNPDFKSGVEGISEIMQTSSMIRNVEETEVGNLVDDKSFLMHVREDGTLILLSDPDQKELIVNTNNYEVDPSMSQVDPPSLQADLTAKKRTLPCDLCNFKAVNRYKLKAHVKIVHEKQKPFICEKCDYRTVTLNKLNAHILEVHHREKPFSCHFCDFRSARQYNLNVHVSQVHHQEKNFGCQLCDFKAPRKDKVRKHLFVKHGTYGEEALGLISIKKPLFNFSKSTNVSTIEDLLPKEPLMLKDLDVSAEVSTCPIQASEIFPGSPPPVEMTIDITSENHEGIEEIVVSTIDESESDMLRSLQPTKGSKKSKKNSNELRNYACSLCDYKSTRSNTLKTHILAIHKGVKNLNCSQCGYKTLRTGDLNRHIRTVHKSSQFNGI